MTLVFRHAPLIDGTGREPEDATVIVEGDRIDAVVGSRAAIAADSKVLDCTGLTLLPGLIDAHTHMGAVAVSDPAAIAVAIAAAHIFRNCELALQAGFTTAREVGGLDGGVAEAIKQGLIAGPRLHPSGPLHCQTGGHGDFGPAFLDPHHQHLGTPGLSQMTQPCDGVEGVRIAVRTAFRRGATQIKMCVSGGVVSLTDRLEDTQFTVEELSAAVEEARARDTYVTAHAHGVAGILNAIDAGLECIEHGTFLDEATAARMADADVALVPTLAITRVLLDEWRSWGISEAVLPRLHGVEAAMRTAVEIAQSAGVRIGSGSDLLGIDQNRRGLEIALKAEVLGPMAAIVSATSASARIMRVGDRVGTVTPGMLADLIAVDGDPLTDPEIFADPDRVVLVVQGGRVVKDRRS